MIVFWVFLGLALILVVLPVFVIGFIKYMTWLGKITGITKEASGRRE